jgi:hypothetical protein
LKADRAPPLKAISVGRLLSYPMHVCLRMIILSIALSSNGNIFAQKRIPGFTDYPAEVIRTGTSVKVKIHSTGDTSCFRTMLRNTVRSGERFAGHYVLSYWGCGTECARLGIVDMLIGHSYVSPFSVTGVGIKVRWDSRLLIVNDPDAVGSNYGVPSPLRYKPNYYLWTGRHLLLIANGKVTNEPEREFKRCRDM